MPNLTIFIVWKKKLEVYLRHERKNFHKKYYVTELQLSSQNRIKSESYVGYHQCKGEVAFYPKGSRFQNSKS